jgi:hypothetical protein
MGGEITAERVRRGDMVVAGRGVYQVRSVARVHEASVRLTFQSWGSITLRRNTKVWVTGNEPLRPRKGRPGRPPS